MINVDKALPAFSLVVKVKLCNRKKVMAFRKRWNGNAWRWVNAASGSTIPQMDVLFWKLIPLDTPKDDTEGTECLTP